MTMNLKKLMISVAVCAFGFSGIAEAKTFRFGHGQPAGHPRDQAAQFFAKRVDELSKGEMKITVGASSSFGDDVEMITALRLGTLDFSANSQGPLAAAVPEVAMIGLPFLFKDAPTAWKVLDGPVGDELAKLTEAKKMVLLANWCNGIRHITNNVRPIKTVDDIKGLKIRTTPSDAVVLDIFEAVGANPTPVKFSELYLALQQGVIDGQENPFANIYASKFHEVQKYLSVSGHKYEHTPLLISGVTWGKLSDEEKKIIRQAADESRDFQREVSSKSDLEYKQKIADYGVEIIDLERQGFVDITKPVYEKWKKVHPEFVELISKAAQEAN